MWSQKFGLSPNLFPGIDSKPTNLWVSATNHLWKLLMTGPTNRHRSFTTRNFPLRFLVWFCSRDDRDIALVWTDIMAGFPTPKSQVVRWLAKVTQSDLLDPRVGGHQQPLKGSRELTIPKRSRLQNCWIFLKYPRHKILQSFLFFFSSGFLGRRLGGLPIPPQRVFGGIGKTSMVNTSTVNWHGKHQKVTILLGKTG